MSLSKCIDPPKPSLLVYTNMDEYEDRSIFGGYASMGMLSRICDKFNSQVINRTEQMVYLKAKQAITPFRIHKIIL